MGEDFSFRQDIAFSPLNRTITDKSVACMVWLGPNRAGWSQAPALAPERIDREAGYRLGIIPGSEPEVATA
jgi:hypothetical protein